MESGNNGFEVTEGAEKSKKAKTAKLQQTLLGRSNAGSIVCNKRWLSLWRKE